MIKLYYFDSFGVMLHKLLRDKTFPTIEEAKEFISENGRAGKHVKHRCKHAQIVICQKFEHKWSIVEILNPVS
jgi:hypothetical protein